MLICRDDSDSTNTDNDQQQHADWCEPLRMRSMANSNALMRARFECPDKLLSFVHTLSTPGRYNNTMKAHVTVVCLGYDKKMDANHVGVHEHVLQHDHRCD
jgi:hypothetical protein